ncbi:MAG TPA: response regulator [Pirellulales bacterium]|nr:response regulator [Pirellulales bacterium]
MPELRPHAPSSAQPRPANPASASKAFSAPGQAGVSGGSRSENPRVVYTPPAADAKGASPPPGVLRVLVVEDNLDQAESLEKTLKTWGYDSRICTSGSEALALAPYYQPRVVLIDIGLPDMTGWQLAESLRKQAGSVGAVFIAVTAYGDEDDYRRSQRVGISYHLVKPSFQHQLHEILSRLAGGGE